MRYGCAAIAAFTLGISAGSGPLEAADLDALDGKTIRIVVGAQAGGGSDAYARMLGAALEQVLPETTIGVQNMGGAGGGLAAAEVEHAEGALITVAFLNSGIVYAQLLADEGEFDISGYQWIGSVGDNQRMVAMRKDLGAPELATLSGLGRQAKEAIAGTAGSASYTESMLLNAMGVLNASVAPDFDDEQILALMMAEDVDLTVGSYGSIKAGIDAGDVVPVLLFSREGYPPEFADVPVLAEVVPAGAFDEIVLFLESLSRNGRLVGAAPSTPAEEVAALREAFLLATKDPAYEAAMAERGFLVNASSGEDLAERMHVFLGQGPEFRDMLARLVACGEEVAAGGTASCK